VILEVVPNITNNGYVRMTLAPEQKVRKGDAGGFGQTSIPIVDERKVESNVIVKDEETVVLGGLRQLDNSISEKGVPWLMRGARARIPFPLHRNRFRENRLILFITPHIIKDPTLSPEELRKYELVDYNWDLPDYFYDETRLRDQPKGEEVKK
jgi:type II secretory pathway component HofQ